MPFNITEFASSIDKNGISRTDLFEVFIGNEKDLTYRARSVNLPGRNVNILEYFELGPEYKLGSFTNYQDISIKFICSSDLRERDYFLNWQDKIVGNHRVRNINAGYLQESYYDDYVKDMEIRIYNETGLWATKITQLTGVFPTTVGDISYDWGTVEHATIDVSFAYRHLRENDQRFLT